MGTTMFVVGTFFHLPDLALGFALAIPLLIAVTGLGWRSAIPLVPVGFAIVWFTSRMAGNPASSAKLSALLGAMLLATLAGHGLYGLWNRSDRRARAAERRARLLGRATIELHASQDEDTLYQVALRLLADVLNFGHAEVFVPTTGAMRLRAGSGTTLPEGFEISMDGIVGRAFRTAQPQHIADTGHEASYVSVPELESARSELALPIHLGSTVHVVLNVEHAEPNAFSLADRRTLNAFCRVIEDALIRLQAIDEIRRERSEKAFLARLTQHLLEADDARSSARVTLEDLIGEFGCGTGAIVTLRTSRLRTLAVHGQVSEDLARLLDDGLPFIGLARQAWSEREPLFVRDCRDDPRVSEIAIASGARALAIVPITNIEGQVQALLLLGDVTKERVWDARSRALLAVVATSLGVALDRAMLHRQLMALLATVRDLASAERPEDVYGRAAEAAVELIPGAEAASILVRGDQGFRYAAASGFDLEALTALGPFSEADSIAWYHGDEAAYRRGVARIVTGADVALLSGVAGGDRGLVTERAGRVADICANLTVPISDHGEVVATLNVDNFSYKGAFGTSAMRLAEAFGQQIAVIVKQANAMGGLRRSAVTDALTGLGNREGFQRRLDEELSRAQRYQRPVSLLLIDLDNFKKVNDTFGHHVGDRALIAVAEVLRREQRTSDSVFRWGGDEFVLLLPESDGNGAQHLAGRLCNLIMNLDLGGASLRASVGVSSYPTDGADRDALLRHADDLMYGHKNRRSPGPGLQQVPRAPEPLA